MSLSAHLFSWRHAPAGWRQAGTKSLRHCDLHGAVLPQRRAITFSSVASADRAAGATMTHDDDFEPRLGKIRSGGGKSGRRYQQRVLKAIALAGGRPRGSSSRRGAFHGNRIGRGAGVGRVLASRDRYAAFRTRRVIMKARIVKLAGKGREGGAAPSSLHPARWRHARGSAGRAL